MYEGRNLRGERCSMYKLIQEGRELKGWGREGGRDAP